MSLILWEEMLPAWQSGDFHYVHDWLNERWARAAQATPAGEADPFARFLQGLAFAALAFHFAGEQNRESAELFVVDGLERLPRYQPAYAGIEVTPIVDALAELRDGLANTPPEQPLPPFLPGPRALRFARGGIVAATSRQ